MSHGTVIGIFITAQGAQPLHNVQQVRAVPGKGLEGDRYFLATGSFSEGGWEADGEATLIESEALEALQRDNSIKLHPHEARRNLLTRGVALNHLVGREFTVGGVRMEGIKLCEPCKHLEKLTQKGVCSGLVHRGGLRARILTEGIIHTGDAIIAQSAMAVPSCA